MMNVELLSDAVLDDFVFVPFMFTRPVFEVRQGKQDGGDNIYMTDIYLPLMSPKMLWKYVSSFIFPCTYSIKAYYKYFKDAFFSSIDSDREDGCARHCLETIILVLNLSGLVINWLKKNITAIILGFNKRNSVRIWANNCKYAVKNITADPRQWCVVLRSGVIQFQHKAFILGAWGQGMQPFFCGIAGMLIIFLPDNFLSI